MSIDQMKKISLGTRVMVISFALAVAVSIFIIGYLLYAGHDAVGMQSAITILAINLGFLFYGTECAREQMEEYGEKGS